MLAIERNIPYGSQLLVSEGQTVLHHDSIAIESRIGELVRILIADQLKISPEKAENYITVKVGQKVSSGDLLANFTALCGLVNQKIYSYCDGIVERFVAQDGTIEIRTHPEITETKSYINGTVDLITSNQITIIVDGFKIQGSVGFGGEVVAPAASIDSLKEGIKSIFIAKNSDEIQQVLQYPQLLAKVAGVVVYQIDNNITKRITSLNHPLVQVSDNLPFTLLLLDRFGTESMPTEIYQKLLSSKGKNITIFPKTQIRAGGVRPYLVVS